MKKGEMVATIPEKKKRFPKPTMTVEVDNLIRFYIPFIEANDQEARLEAAVKIGQIFDIRCADKTTGKNIKIAREVWTESDFSHMQETADMLKRAIGHVTHGEATQPNSETETLLPWLNLHLNESTRHLIGWSCAFGGIISWGYPPEWVNQTGTAKEALVGHWPKIIRAWGVHLVVEAFKSNMSEKDKITLSRTGKVSGRLILTGKAYIGACPRCGKVFEKPRADSLYCGKYCMHEVFRTTKKK